MYSSGRKQCYGLGAPPGDLRDGGAGISRTQTEKIEREVKARLVGIRRSIDGETQGPALALGQELDTPPVGGKPAVPGIVAGVV